MADDPCAENWSSTCRRRSTPSWRQGMSPTDAEHRARLLFGGVAQVEAACRDERRWRLLDELRDDLRFAVRLARRTPTLTATTLLALAIGIGASSTIFAVINGILLKPLPYREPDRLVMVWSESPVTVRRENTISPADYRDFAARTRTLERLEGYFSFLSTLEMGFGDRTEVANAQVVTSGLFELLGRPAALGRTFRTDSYAPDIVLSDGYWRRRFGADPSVIGRAITIGSQPGTIVGVMPPDVVFPVSRHARTIGVHSRDERRPVGVDGLRGAHGGRAADDGRAWPGAARRAFPRCHRPDQAGSIDRAGAVRSRGRRRRTRRRLSRQQRRLGRHRAAGARSDSWHDQARPAAAARWRGSRVAHGHCERGEPDAVARSRAARRVRDACRPRGRPRAVTAAVGRRKPAADRSRRPARPGGRTGGPPCPYTVGAARPAAARGHCAGLARPCRHHPRATW